MKLLKPIALAIVLLLLAATGTRAGAAPDHGLLTPWRFILVPGAQRHYPWPLV